MERAAQIDLSSWPTTERSLIARTGGRTFAFAIVASAVLSALIASWLPLQLSIITVFLFAGPHNLFEFRYFLTRMPARLGKSRNFFLLAFGGIAVLTIAYIALPTLFYLQLWSGANWVTLISVWNAALLLWLAALISVRGKQTRRDWGWTWPLAFGLISMNWVVPELFSVALVYTHPLIALWFLDRQLRHTRPEWLRAYHRCLALLPLLIVAMCWQLAKTPSLGDDNGLAWRITQHAGAEILPNISSHLLVSVHVFLEMLHYAVWLVVLPLLTTKGRVWDLKTIPLVKHPRGFPRLITIAMVMGLFCVAVLWTGFAVDYSTTRDIYFAVAITHVLAEAPFLLRTM